MTEHELAGLEVILAKSDVDGWSLVPSEVCQKLLATARSEARMREALEQIRRGDKCGVPRSRSHPGSCAQKIASEALAQADDGDGGKR